MKPRTGWSRGTGRRPFWLLHVLLLVLLSGSATAAEVRIHHAEEFVLPPKALPAADVKLMEHYVLSWQSARRFYTLLLTIFAGLAVMLAMIGIYGVLSNLVTSRVLLEPVVLHARAVEAGNRYVLQGERLRDVEHGALLAADHCRDVSILEILDRSAEVEGEVLRVAHVREHLRPSVARLDDLGCVPIRFTRERDDVGCDLGEPDCEQEDHHQADDGAEKGWTTRHPPENRRRPRRDQRRTHSLTDRFARRRTRRYR